MPRPRLHTSDAARQAAYRLRRQEQPSPVQEPVPKDNPSNRADYRRWHRLALNAAHTVQLIGEEMARYYDARSSTWQEDERGEAFMELQELQGELLSHCEEFIASLAQRCPSPAGSSANAMKNAMKEVGPPNL